MISPLNQIYNKRVILLSYLFSTITYFSSVLCSTHFSVTPIFHSSPNYEDDELMFSTGFKTGFIRWDDENSDNNNNYRGAMPDGKFTKNTLIEYCCRTDGHAENDIILPTDTPFVLFKSNSHQCQHVQGMRWKEEWFHWDTEDWSFSGNEKMGSVPYGEVGRNIKLYYCYYYR